MEPHREELRSSGRFQEERGLEGFTYLANLLLEIRGRHLFIWLLFEVTWVATQWFRWADVDVERGEVIGVDLPGSTLYATLRFHF